MVNPVLLCDQHLLGEHGEIHKHRHNFVKGHRIDGRKGQVEPESMGSRHDELADEMVRRGMSHKSPYEQPDLFGYDLMGFTVDREESLAELKRRCQECKRRILEWEIGMVEDDYYHSKSQEEEDMHRRRLDALRRELAA